ncbi:MAG: N-acetylmuramoyl-L-alanine amidase [Candidatus Eisenbacteria bacterium]
MGTNLHRTRIGVALLVAALVPAGQTPRRAAADTPVVVSGARSFSGPTATRVVLEFSRSVAIVAPDSGSGDRVIVTLPGETVTLGPGVPTRLPVADGVLDSLIVETRSDGARFTAWLHDTTAFKVFSLAAQDDKPYRVVLDLTRRGGEAAQQQQLTAVAARKRNDRIRIVAVDPGHGGDDTGAHGTRGVLEKNVTLAVARELVDDLNHIGGVRGVLTRSGDYFIPLRDRYHMAEKMKADLFISIHCNSSRRRGRGNGTEVYFLSLRGADDQASNDLANTENAADLVGGVPPQSEDELVNILYDVKRTSALQQSQLLAEQLLDQVASGSNLESRGIKQAGFLVLKSVEFPSVLVETAFINNPAEAKLLNSRAFQQQLARQLTTGVKNYFDKAGITLGGTSPAP